MTHSMDKNVRQTRFAIADLQKRIEVLEATREDLERQIRKLNDSVPEEEVQGNEQREGYVAYGSYAKSCLLYTSPSPRDRTRSRMPSSA